MSSKILYADIKLNQNDKTIIFFLICFFPFYSFGQSNLLFQTDTGYRLDSATTRKVVLVHDTMFLYYGAELDTNGTPIGLAISTDMPDYLNFTRVNINDYPKYYYHQLPNGNYRKYTYDAFAGGVKSETSVDGYTSTLDTGIRYTLQPGDSDIFGVSTYFNDTLGNVHMLYMGGIANARHAVSYDGGDNFTFISNNVLGDYGPPDGNYNYWDPYAIVMPDNAIRVFTMSQEGISAPPVNPTGYIFTFLSTDGGQTFNMEYDSYGDSVRFKYNDFTGMTNTSVNDPKAVVLQDGRIRVFVNGFVLQQLDSSYRWQILSATSGCDNVPVADFTYTNTGTDYNFHSTSSDADSYYWDFGDGSNDTTLTPPHHYNQTGNYTVCLIASNTCGNDTICQQLSVTAGISNNNRLANAIKIFPNPAVNRLTVRVKTTTPSGNIIIRNTIGQILIKTTIIKSLNNIDVSNLSSGLYIVEINTSQHIAYRKFIKE